MDVLEAAETNLGKFVPLHLLKFRGDTRLQSSFRQLIEEDYGKGIVKNEKNLCQACGLFITSNNPTRMKPSKKKTQKILKLLAKEKTGTVFGKHNNFVLDRYKRSCTQLIVRCPKCQELNKKNLISNETKCLIKEKNLQAAYATVKSKDLTASQKKKRRKKKKGNSVEQDNCGLIISSPVATSSDQDKASQLDIALQPKQNSFTTPHHKSRPNVSINSSISKKSSTLNRKQIPYSHLTKESPGSSTPARSKKTRLNQKDLKQILQQNESGTTRASLSDFLSSL